MSDAGATVGLNIVSASVGLADKPATGPVIVRAFTGREVHLEDCDLGQGRERNDRRAARGRRLVVRHGCGRVRVPDLAGPFALCVRGSLLEIVDSGRRIGRHRGGLGSDQLWGVNRLFAATSLLHGSPAGLLLRELLDGSAPRDTTNFSGSEWKCRGGIRRARRVHSASRQRGRRGGAHVMRGARVLLSTSVAGSR